MNKLIVILVAIVFMCSCGGDSSNTSNGTTDSPGKPVEINTPIQHSSDDGHDHSGHDHAAHAQGTTTVTKGANTGNTDPAVIASTKVNNKNFDADVPDACTLITVEEVAKILGVDAMKVNLKDGSNKITATTRSCFFRWATSSNPNEGILIQVQKNPIPDEYAEWPTLFIDSKIQNGEQTFDGTDVNYKYTKWDFVGDAGCYSFEAGKYHWRVADDFVFMVAFNTGAGKSKQLKQAEQLAQKVMNSFNATR